VIVQQWFVYMKTNKQEKNQENDMHQELRDNRIGQYFPQVNFVIILEFFIQHKVQTEF
jgi:hypothetical protein